MTSRALFFRTPRVAGTAIVLFLATFALDAGSISAFAIHLLPAAVCAAVLAVAWRVPSIGAIGFGILAVGYALSIPSRPDWIVTISGPLALLAVLFMLSPSRLPRQCGG